MAGLDRKGTLVVGVSGNTGSGKTTAAAVFEQFGFEVRSTRTVLEHVLIERGSEVTRVALQTLGAEVHTTLGQNWLLGKVVEGIQNGEWYVVDGLRFREDVLFLASRYGTSFSHLHIEAPIHLRRNRYTARGGTFDEFRAAERSVTESEAPELRSVADWAIANVGKSEDLAVGIAQFLEARIGRGPWQ